MVLRLLVQRVSVLIPTLLLATFIVYLLVLLVPGDPAIAILGDQATEENLAALREQLGLNEPVLLRYWNWLTDILRGDMGKSLLSREEVFTAVKRTFPTTLQIVVGGMLVAVLLGVPAGVLSARRANSAVDNVIASASSAGVAMPSFWLGLILVSVFSLRLGWFPATGFKPISQGFWQSVKFTALPSIAIGTVGAAEVTRQLRGAMIEVLNTDYVRTLRAKGISEASLIWKHALKNCAVPLMTILGLQINRFLGATVVIEAVFGISGLGTLVVNATQKQDMPVVQGVLLLMVLLVVATSFLVDVSYRIFDPRIR